MHLDALNRHQRIAFQFSGGKDSTAALFLLRPYWDRMTVYWLDSGDSFPETRALIHEVLSCGINNFVRVQGRVHEVVAEFGPPSEVVPFSASEAAHNFGVAQSASIQDRSMCCARSKMLPMHQRMIDDEITLIIRGQKNCDQFKGPFKSGDRVDGFEFLYPVETWTDQDVFAYLALHCPAAANMYAHLDKSGDCMRCSAWLGDNRGGYLKQHHPIAFHDYRERLRIIAGACAPAITNVFAALADACDEDALAPTSGACATTLKDLTHE